jgi:hypothetical protein
MTRLLLTFFGVVLATGLLTAQDTATVDVGDRNILFRKEASGGIFIHSSGLGVSYKSGRHVTAFKKRIISLDFVSLKHPKEYKTTNPLLFGKLNFVYIFRAGYGFQHVLFSKAERSGVEVRYNYYGGLSLGFTKPVYLDVIVSTTDNLILYETKRYDPTDPGQQDVTDFVGRGPYFMGFDQIKIYPGGHLKGSVSFEYAGWERKIAALEAGVTVDAFPKAIPIMANNKNQNLYFNFFISLMWGAKYN